MQAACNRRCCLVPTPGNAIVADMEAPVPQTIKIVDHSMTRAMNKGAMEEIEISGKENPEIFNAKPSNSSAL